MRRGVPVEPVDLQLAWPLTGVSIGVDMASYPTRRVFAIASDQGTFVAKVSPVSDQSDNAGLLVLDYLVERNFAHAPSLLLTRSGDRTAQVGDGVVAVLEYVPRAVDDGGSP